MVARWMTPDGDVLGIVERIGSVFLLDWSDRRSQSLDILTAAARCIGLLSLPMKSAHDLSSAAVSPKLLPRHYARSLHLQACQDQS